MEDSSNVPLADRYIADFKSSYGATTWNLVANDCDGRTALSDAAIMDLSQEKRLYHAISYMSNRISFTNLQSEGASTDEDSTLVLVSSAPTNSGVQGDRLATTQERCPPDLVVTHGVLSRNGKVDITSLNRCGGWGSKPVPIASPHDDKRDDDTIPAADIRIAYAVLLYQTLADRDLQIRSLDGRGRRPCAQVLDLDHGVLMDVMYPPDYIGRKERVGTPMFISAELSLKSDLEIAGMDPNFLIAQLRRIESQPDLFARAFPHGDGAFMDGFLRAVKLEQDCSRKGAYAVIRSGSPHRPYNDAESFYWILTWAFTRACPLGFNPDGGWRDPFSQFADVMLQHKFGDEDDRSTKLYGSGVGSILHPELRPRFAPLLRQITRYLAIPWNHYMHFMQPYHAHIAIRRLLLPWIQELTIEKHNNIVLDTKPRMIRTDW